MIDFISLHLILSKSGRNLCNHPENKDNAFPRNPPFRSFFYSALQILTFYLTEPSDLIKYFHYILKFIKSCALVNISLYK